MLKAIYYIFDSTKIREKLSKFNLSIKLSATGLESFQKIHEIY